MGAAEGRKGGDLACVRMMQDRGPPGPHGLAEATSRHGQGHCQGVQLSDSIQRGSFCRITGRVEAAQEGHRGDGGGGSCSHL